MCTAIPARVVAIGEKDGISIPATVTVGGVEREADLSLVPEAGIGDYVVVHSGYAISISHRGRAEETIDMLGLSD